MTPRLFPALALCLSLPVAALASGDMPRLTPEIEAQIRTSLTEQGYDVRKIKMDDGYYEAYARKDGERLELYLDADMKIVRTKRDD